MANLLLLVHMRMQICLYTGVIIIGLIVSMKSATTRLHELMLLSSRARNFFDNSNLFIEFHCYVR